MRIVPTLAVGAFLLLAGEGFAQEHPSQMRRDQSAVVVAALDWYAGLPHKSLETFVVASKTTDWETRSPESLRLGRSPERLPTDLNLPQAALEHMAARAGARRVEKCDTMSLETNSVCGVPGPWIWIVYSLPWVRGDEARVELEIRGLSWVGPRVGKGHREANNYLVLLTRQRGVWVVTSVMPPV